MSGFALWITGLPGSGKSTIADELKRARPDFAVLRMDELRKIVTPNPTYSDFERDIVYKALVYLSKKLTELEYDVIIDATGNLRKWRDFARQLLPRFLEVYLRCPIELCIQRERTRVETHAAPTEIYKKGNKGWPVPGLVVPYEEPLNPEIVIDTGNTPIQEAVKRILNEIERLKS